MKLFRCTCPARRVLHFENVTCGACGRLTGFDTARGALRPYDSAEDHWVDDDGRAYRLCANRTLHGVCNWMVPLASGEGGAAEPFCIACRLNRVIPDLSVAGNLELWRALEQAKRRCLFTFLELALPFDGNPPAVPPLGFRFMADRTTATNFEAPSGVPEPVVTGHDDGLVTINLAEADAIARIRTQLAMRERYRTLLGHFRHETGHYFWDWFNRADAGFVERFRIRFGDERADYQQAVARHYAAGPPATWQMGYISAYATVHPWEDWAETWAHYLHIVDTLETWQSFGHETRLDTAGIRDVRLPFRAGAGREARPSDFAEILPVWIEASVMLNGLNRSMGQPDPYPFVLNGPASDKLRFVHETVGTFCARGVGG